MLWIDVGVVSFGSEQWGGVVSLAVNSKGTKVLTEHGSAGCSPVFIDVVERETTIVVEREVTEGDAFLLLAGGRGLLVANMRKGGGDARSVKLTATCTVVSVKHKGGRTNGFVQEITLLAEGGAGGASAELNVSL